MQAKLAMGTPGDVYEREADRIADQVTPHRAPEGKGPPEHARPALGSLISGDLSQLRGGGQPLPDTVRETLEPRMGYDFLQVRLHTGERAANSAEAINARAYTVGRDIVFGSGQYTPHTSAGQHLLAHELTHVAQQGAASARAHSNPPANTNTSDKSVAPPVQASPVQVQGGFFGDLWEGIKSVGSAIGTGIKAVGGAIATGAKFVAETIRDAAAWVFNLVRDLPARLSRLITTIAEGVWGIVSFVPEMIMALVKGGWKGLGAFLVQKLIDAGTGILTLISRVFDLVGGPELIELTNHMLALGATPLTSDEIRDAKSVLGENAIRWRDVRVTEGGLWRLIFLIQDPKGGGRAVTTWHTINMPPGERQAKRDVMVHELTHVYQYEKVGTQYLGQAVHAQATIGYDYGRAAGLEKDFKAGKKYRDYNREQQAQIAQDYYTLLQRDPKKEAAAAGNPADEANIAKDIAAAKKSYQPFIAELQAGQL